MKFRGQDRTSPLRKFADKWSHPDRMPEKITEAGLVASEAGLGIRFPSDYRDQVLAVGRPAPTLALLSAICDREPDLYDLADLLDPSDIIRETEEWIEIGMPDHLVVFGNDHGGNKFCFSKHDLKAAATSKAPVYFWDHDFNSTKRVARSFSRWMLKYTGRWSRGLTYADF